MIVIATHNHNIALLRLLKSIQQNGGAERILVVDTCSPQSLKSLRKTIQSTYPSVVLDRTAKPDYDTGAYLHAFRYYKDEEYLFLHDSLEVIQPDFMTAFRQTATDLDTVVPWMGVEPFYTAYTDVHFSILTKLFKEPHPLSSPPSYAFFGPIFYASRQGMEKMQSAGFLNFAPQNKTEAQVTEQVWSLWASRSGLAVKPVSTLWRNIFTKGYTPVFRKYLLGRT